MPRVYAMSQEAAEAFKPIKDCALISIATPKLRSIDYGVPNLVNWFNAGAPVLRLSFHDADPRKGSDPGLVFMTEQDAKLIIEFVRANLGRDLYINCYAGISRSNAVVRAIHQLFGFQIGSTASEQLANKHVWRLITDTFAGADLR